MALACISMDGVMYFYIRWTAMASESTSLIHRMTGNLLALIKSIGRMMCQRSGYCQFVFPWSILTPHDIVDQQYWPCCYPSHFDCIRLDSVPKEKIINVCDKSHKCIV